MFYHQDLGVIRYISDEIMVVHAGHIDEYVSAESVFSNHHINTLKHFLSAAPIPDPNAVSEHIRLEGVVVPTVKEAFKGCFFASRCHQK